MAKATYISDFERDVIRIGYSRGIKAPDIARFLGRTKVAVYNQIKAMDAAGTLGDLPFCFAANEIAAAILAGRADQ